MGMLIGFQSFQNKPDSLFHKRMRQYTRILRGQAVFRQRIDWRRQLVQFKARLQKRPVYISAVHTEVAPLSSEYIQQKLPCIDLIHFQNAGKRPEKCIPIPKRSTDIVSVTSGGYQHRFLRVDGSSRGIIIAKQGVCVGDLFNCFRQILLGFPCGAKFFKLLRSVPVLPLITVPQQFLCRSGCRHFLISQSPDSVKPHLFSGRKLFRSVKAVFRVISALRDICVDSLPAFLEDRRKRQNIRLSHKAEHDAVIPVTVLCFLPHIHLSGFVYDMVQRVYAALKPQ